MLVGCECAVVIVASEYGIGEALAGSARATSHQGIGYGAVAVVDDADGRGGRRGLNVKGHGDRAIRIHDDVGAIHIFGELAAVDDTDSCRGNCGPYVKGSCDQGVGRGIGQVRTEGALIRVISNESLRPDQGLSGGGGVEVAGPGNELGTTGAGKQYEDENHCRR